jgi:NhaP-type Na+/H+ or K+/H+ antiporter
VGVLARALPHRNVTLLRAESLINDGTALVIYGLAVGFTVGEEHLSVPHISWLFLHAYAGGAAAGAVTAWLGVQVRRRLDDPLLGNVVTILTPFTAFLLAEAIHASGVLAVVVSGLMMSQLGPRVVRAALRLGLLARKRATVVRLRDERRIGDAVLRQVQAALDIEEVRLSRREVVD